MLDLGADLDGEWAQGLREGDRDADGTQALRIRVDPRLEIGLPGGWSARALLRLRADALDRLDPGSRTHRELIGATRPRQVGNHGEVELRELFVSGDLGPIRVRAGKQQIVWGISDRIPLLDVVDPFDFREFILPEEEDHRVPLWSLLLECRVGSIDMEFVWTPDTSVSLLPERDGVFALSSPLLVPRLGGAGARVDVDSLRHPDSTPDNWDLGMRLSTFLGGWDLAATLLRRIDDLPVYGIRNLGTRDGIPRLRVVPRNLQVLQAGASATRPFGAWTIRSEAAFVAGRGFLTRSRATALPVGAQDGFDESEELLAVFGIDWFGIENTLLSAQVHPRWALDHDARFTRDELEIDLTFRASRSLLHDSVDLELQWVHSLNRHDGLVRPRIRFAWSDRVALSLGFDLFYGSKRGIFGQYDRLDRAVLGIEVSL